MQLSPFHPVAVDVCMCVAPVKVIDIADVAKQGVFILRAQRRAGLVADALQVVLKEMRKKKWFQL